MGYTYYLTLGTCERVECDEKNKHVYKGSGSGNTMASLPERERERERGRREREARVTGQRHRPGTDTTHTILT